MWINLDAFEQPKDVSPSFQIVFKHLQKCSAQIQFLLYLNLLSEKSHKGRLYGAN